MKILFDWKEKGYPRTLGNGMELKELVISKAQRMRGEPEKFGRQEEKSQKLSQGFLESEYYFQLVFTVPSFLEFLHSLK